MPHQQEVAAYTDKITYATEHIRTIDKLFIVCYNKEPILVTTGHVARDQTRLQRTVFVAERQAQRLADRLNTRYKTDQFTVEVFGNDKGGNDSVPGPGNRP